MAKLQHFESEGSCYLVTVSVFERKPLLRDPENAKTLIQVIYNQRSKGRFYLLGFVVMPEHFHILMVPRNSTRLPFVMQEIKKGSARLINMATGNCGKFWMDEYHDSIVRGEQDLLVNLEYLANNPVRRGLVSEPSEYRFSSTNGTYKTDLEELFSGSGTTPSTGER